MSFIRTNKINVTPRTTLWVTWSGAVDGFTILRTLAHTKGRNKVVATELTNLNDNRMDMVNESIAKSVAFENKKFGVDHLDMPKLHLITGKAILPQAWV